MVVREGGQRRNFFSWKKVCEKEVELECVHVLFQGTGLKKGSSIQPRKGPEYHHMKFGHYPMILKETPSKRGSTVIWFSVQKYLSGCGRLAFKASCALATPHIAYFTWLCLCPLSLHSTLSGPLPFLIKAMFIYSSESLKTQHVISEQHCTFPLCQMIFHLTL